MGRHGIHRNKNIFVCNSGQNNGHYPKAKIDTSNSIYKSDLDKVHYRKA